MHSVRVIRATAGSFFFWRRGSRHRVGPKRKLFSYHSRTFPRDAV
jgi:hypothetical protein